VSAPFRVFVAEADGSTRVEELGTDRLSALQRLVGGYIEQVPGWRIGALVALVNEEGWLRDLAPNPYGPRWLQQPIAGPIVILREGREDFAGLRAPDIASLVQSVAEVARD